jgi:hypothetical protein
MIKSYRKPVEVEEAHFTLCLPLNAIKPWMAAGHLWLTPAILATQEAEIREIVI